VLPGQYDQNYVPGPERGLSLPSGNAATRIVLLPLQAWWTPQVAFHVGLCYVKLARYQLTATYRSRLL